MKVILAESAGFCFGVERAVNTVKEQIAAQLAVPEEERLPIYTYGSIIHNKHVVSDFENKGVKVIGSLEELETIHKGVVIIRSHGVEKKVYDIMEQNGVTCVDATCPFVKRIHTIVHTESEKGTHIIIVGNDGHPEVEGIKGWVVNTPDVIGTKEEAENFQGNLSDNYCIVSQTTFQNDKFQDIVDIFCNKGYNVNVVNTICNATHERQEEACKISETADIMIVIGDPQSSNSRKLYEICRKECENTYFIQTLDDLHPEIPDTAKTVGITAGASTPNNIIEEVQSYVRRNF
ncbi:MAG: 4-hydroxy-3-methylbut-2-enyl diphosphate reductase [Lachnospiraceae bacterium]|nr:4-hydroxy-3-methylbut-2-enyl diphosphate reductase [Lachnospiraceae bacterium]